MTWRHWVALAVVVLLVVKAPHDTFAFLASLWRSVGVFFAATGLH